MMSSSMIESTSSILATSNGVKRRLDEGVSDVGTNWERELCWENQVQDAKRHCATAGQFTMDSTQYHCFMDYGSSESSVQLSNSNLTNGTIHASQDLSSSTVNVESTNMEVDNGNDCESIIRKETVESGSLLLETSTRSIGRQGPRCYCRVSWDPMFDLVPYVSDIY